jgi:hypothetical protein
VSWECRYKSGELCNKLGENCDPGRKGCVLRGKVYFPFAPEKNPPGMNVSQHPDPDSGKKPSARR